VKLTLKIKLLPNKEQAGMLRDTIAEYNVACDTISDVAWENKVFNQFKLHRLVYHNIRSATRLPAQLTVRAISKVVDAYKLDKKVKRVFRKDGAITYDCRVMSYKGDLVSLSTLDGRVKVPFICHRPDWLPYVKGEADLLVRKGKFFLLQTVEFPEDKIKDAEEFLGVDLGITDIATLSDGTAVSSQWINEYRQKRSKVRASVQRKGTRSSKRLLKRLSGRERSTATLVNHTLSKRIVRKAKSEGKGIAIEELRHIRGRAKGRGKTMRTMLNRWSFGQLRSFLEYKAKMEGVKLLVVPAPYTSKTCSVCMCIGDRRGKKFNCTKCGHAQDADHNAARNIAALGGAVNRPEGSTMFCALHGHGQVQSPLY